MTTNQQLYISNVESSISTSDQNENPEQDLKYILKKFRTRLYEIFEMFSKFGQREVPLQHPLHSTLLKSKDPYIMDGSKFAKFCRDANLVDGKCIDSTEVDLMFNRVKSKNERKINFQQFQMALYSFSKKRCQYFDKKDENTVFRELLEQVILCPGPMLASVTLSMAPKLNTSEIPRSRYSMSSAIPECLTGRLSTSIQPNIASRHSLMSESTKTNSSVFDRLTDSRYYTGTQRQRFQTLASHKPTKH